MDVKSLYWGSHVLEVFLHYYSKQRHTVIALFGVSVCSFVCLSCLWVLSKLKGVAFNTHPGCQRSRPCYPHVVSKVRTGTLQSHFVYACPLLRQRSRVTHMLKKQLQWTSLFFLCLTLSDVPWALYYLCQVVIKPTKTRQKIMLRARSFLLRHMSLKQASDVLGQLFVSSLPFFPVLFSFLFVVSSVITI